MIQLSVNQFTSSYDGYIATHYGIDMFTSNHIIMTKWIDTCRMININRNDSLDYLVRLIEEEFNTNVILFNNNFIYIVKDRKYCIDFNNSLFKALRWMR